MLRWNKIIYFKKSSSVAGIDKHSKVWALTYITIDHSIHFLIQCFSVVKLCPTLYHTMDRSTPGFSVLHYLPAFVQTLVHWVSDAIQPSHLLSLPLLLPSIFPSIRVLSNESALHIRWPEYWSISFSINPSNEYSGLISFRIDWYDLIDDQGTLKSLLQHHSSKASILWCSVFCWPALTSIHDYWKIDSFDCMNICQQSHVSAF